MNKLITLFVVLILSSNTAIFSNNESVTTIKNTSSKIRPNSLVEQPFSCAYQNGHISITFSQNIGRVEVTVFDLMSGEMYIKTGSSSTRHWIIPVSSVGGSCIVEVVTAAGDQYSIEISD